MSRFAADFTAANDLLAEAFGEQVDLVRKGQADATGVTAQVTSQTYEGEDDQGIGVTFEATDFVLDMDDYDFGSGAVTPRDGDQIKRTINAVVHTYKVAPVPGRRCCEPDVDRGEWLIHTKHIDP